MIRRLVMIVMALALAASLASCGKKGNLDPPPGKKSSYPRVYPR